MKTCDVCGRIGGTIFDGGVVADVRVGVLNVASVDQDYGMFFDLCSDCIKAVAGKTASMMTELKEEKCLGKYMEEAIRNGILPTPITSTKE